MPEKESISITCNKCGTKLVPNEEEIIDEKNQDMLICPKCKHQGIQLSGGATITFK